METGVCREKRDQVPTEVEIGFPKSLERVLLQNPYENILDSNIFSAYIPKELDVPRIDDPRKTQASDNGVPRHPGYVQSAEINQIFTYIGFIKRTDNWAYRPYLPSLFQELNRFIGVFEEIIFNLDVTISEEIYAEQKAGMENFLETYGRQVRNRTAWIEKIWKQQKNYLEKLDTLVEALRLRGRVFNYHRNSLYRKVVDFCRKFSGRFARHRPSDMDCRFVANCCAKAAIDNTPKTIWSGDLHIMEILDALYGSSGLKNLPEITMRASYAPRRYKQLFP